MSAVLSLPPPPPPAQPHCSVVLTQSVLFFLDMLAQNDAAAAQIEKQKQLQQSAGQAPVQLENQEVPSQDTQSVQVQYTGNPDEIEMMDATDYDPLQVQNYSVNINQTRQVCTLSPTQPYPPSMGLSTSYQGLAERLEQPSVEQMQQDNMFTMQQGMTGAVQVRSPPLLSPTLSPPGLGSPTATSTAAQSPLLPQQASLQLEAGMPRQFQNASLSSSTEPMMESSTYVQRTQLQDTTYQPLGHRKGRLPRNVSDSQLYTMDLSQLGSDFGSSFHSTSLMPSLESDLPPQLQAPNLAAHLQSIPSRTSRSGSLETSSLSGSQPKKARLPRNMSDSGLYNLGNVSSVGSSSFSRQLSTTDQSTLVTGQFQKQKHVQDTSPHSQIPVQSVQKSRSTGKRKSRMPRNMSDSSLVTMQHIQRNMSDSSLVTLQQQQQQQQQQLQAPTVVSLLTGSSGGRRGSLPKTQSSLVSLLSTPHSSAAAPTQTFISTAQTVVPPSTVPLRRNSESSSTSAPAETTQGSLIDQLLREPAQPLVTAPLPAQSFLEAVPITTVGSQTTMTAKTTYAPILNTPLTSADPSTAMQLMSVQSESAAKMSPQHQLLKHLLTLQKDKQPLPTHLLAALQASVDQMGHGVEKTKQDEKRSQQQQQQQQTLQQQLQHLQQQDEQQQIQQQVQQQQQQQQQQIQQQQQQEIQQQQIQQQQQQQQQQEIQQQQQQIQQQQQQQQQVIQVQQHPIQLPKALQYSQSQSQTQQKTQPLLQQQLPQMEQKNMSVKALLQIPSVGYQSNQQLVGSGNSQTQSVFPGTIFITPQQLGLNTAQSLQPNIVTLQQNTQQVVSPQTVTVPSSAAAASQVVEIIQGTGPPQHFVLPAGMKITQTAVNNQPPAVQTVSC